LPLEGDLANGADRRVYYAHSFHRLSGHWIRVKSSLASIVVLWTRVVTTGVPDGVTVSWPVIWTGHGCRNWEMVWIEANTGATNGFASENVLNTRSKTENSKLGGRRIQISVDLVEITSRLFVF
jgi:hypothetical protein